MRMNINPLTGQVVDSKQRLVFWVVGTVTDEKLFELLKGDEE